MKIKNLLVKLKIKIEKKEVFQFLNDLIDL